MPEPSAPETIRFREFELNVAAYELRRNGQAVRLERQPMDLLILLVEQRGQLVTRADIVDRLWGKDVFVDVETGVHTAVRKIRQALRDSADAPTFVETVAGKGYRFVAPVDVMARGAAAPAPARAESRQAPATAQAPVAPGPVARAPVSSRYAAALVGGVVVLGLMAAFAAWRWTGDHAAWARVTLAVLPFENLTGDAELRYLADGLTDEAIASLGQMNPERVAVIGRQSMMVYRGNAAKSLAEIGRELGADYLLESSLRAEGRRFRITTKLIRARDQVQVWSQSYDREPTSMLSLQSELSAAIAEQIRLRLSPERLDALARRQTRNPDAYDLFLRGRNFANQRTAATTRKAIEYFDRATALDPDYALAWAGLAEVYGASPINGDAPPLDVWPHAHQAAAQALRSGPERAEAQFATAYVNWMLDWDWSAAESEFRRATILDASHALAHMMLGHLLSQTGRHDLGRSSMRRARELDPLNPMSHVLSSQLEFQARNYQAALDHARRAIALDPEFWIGHMMRGQALERMHLPEPAIEALLKAGRFSAQNSKTVSLRGFVLARAGRGDEAREVLNTLLTAARERYVPPYAEALVHAGLGDREAVFESLDRAYAARDVHLIFLPVDPKWDEYRQDPRFVALLARCGFASGGSRQGRP
jgi:TolB-like protein/DNA-binding winged helix-turn-helix (wHTH) protein/Flp pilus assembly protein TadD